MRKVNHVGLVRCPTAVQGSTRVGSQIFDWPKWTVDQVGLDQYPADVRVSAHASSQISDQDEQS